jgi:hypothetical protein
MQHAPECCTCCVHVIHVALLTCPQGERVHPRSVTGLDWSFDNSQLLTSGEEGIVLWDAGSMSPIRTISSLALQVSRTHRAHVPA